MTLICRFDGSRNLFDLIKAVSHRVQNSIGHMKNAQILIELMNKLNEIIGVLDFRT